MLATAFRAATLATLVAVAGCSASARDVAPTTQLQRAGGPAGSGGVCAYYSGINSPGRDGLKESFVRRACFPTAAACQSWLYAVQTRFPVTRLRKGCR